MRKFGDGLPSVCPMSMGQVLIYEHYNEVKKMRITNNMMINNMMHNLNRNMNRLDKRMMQAYTGKKIHKPSDDPVAISRSLRTRADISQLYQYNKNVDDAISWVETSELAINSTNEAFHRFRELMVQASNGVLTEEETTKVQEEIKEIKAQIISLGNATYGSSYVFAGKKSDQPLFDAFGNYSVDLIDYKNPAFNDDRQNIQVGTNEDIGVNTLGFEIFEAYEKPVVYSSDLNSLTSGDEIILQMEGDIEVKITFIIGTPEGTTINQQGTEATITIDSTDPDEQMEAIMNGLKEMGEVYESPLKGYNFEVFKANELDGASVNYDVSRIKATPKDAVAVDTREVQAVWQTGEFDVTNLMAGDAENFTFMGVKLNISQGTVTSVDGFDLHDIGKNGATIVIDENITDPNDYAEAVSEAISQAFTSISMENGSKIEGFTFQADGNGGLQVIAPENSGPIYNKETFGGTLEGSNSGTPLVISGDAEKRTVAAGQKSGIVQLIEHLEEQLLKGNTEEISNQLGKIDKFHQNLLRANSEIGAKVNRLDLVKNRIADNTINFKNLLSQLEDADMAEVLMELMNEENVYRSSLSIGARIIQPTLLDFLR